MTSVFASRRLALVAALASSLWLAACGGGGSGGNGTTTLRAINLTSDLPSVDIYTGDTKQFSAVAQDATTASVSVEASTYTLNVKKAGDGATLFTGSYGLAKDKHYTAIVWGRETALRVSTLPEDENTDEITSGNSRIRFFNATSDTGSVDVYLTSATADLGESAATQGALTTGTLSGFRDVSKGTYRLRVTGAGDPNDVRLDIPAITVDDKKFATLELTAGTGGVLVNGTLIGQQAGATTLRNTKARVRIAASVAGSGIVAGSVGGRTLAGGLVSPSVGPYAQVDAGNAVDLTVRVNAAVVAGSGARQFVAGNDYTVIAYGTAAAPTFKVLNDDNRLPSATTRAKIRLVNGVIGSTPQTLSLDFLPLLTDIPGGESSPTYASANVAGASRIDITAIGAADSLFTQSATTTSALLQGQGVYTLFMLDGKATPTGVFRRDR